MSADQFPSHERQQRIEEKRKKKESEAMAGEEKKSPMVGEEKRHQMMQNPFGDQSEEEEEEAEHESNRQPDYASATRSSSTALNYGLQDNEFLWKEKTGITGVDQKGKKKGLPAKILMAERHRRKKLNDRLYMLRSVVPKISKIAQIIKVKVFYSRLFPSLTLLHSCCKRISGFDMARPTSALLPGAPVVPGMDIGDSYRGTVYF